jgi:hypothetical protein
MRSLASLKSRSTKPILSGENQMAWKLKRISNNVHEITIDLGRNKDWEQWVLLRSDVHHDNPKCDQDLERQHLQEALEYDAPIIDNGDLFCAMQGRWDKRADKSAQIGRAHV